jgi:hypothetical protein
VRIERVAKELVRWAGWTLLVAFLASMFLFCLVTLALILVISVLGLIQVAMGYRPDGFDPIVTVLAFLTTVGGLSVTCVYSYVALRSIVGAFCRLITASDAVRLAARSAAGAVGQVLLAALALFVFSFACLGAAFVLMTGTWLAVVLTGHGHERAEEAVVFVFAFPMSLIAFGALSLPGFAFGIQTVRRLRGRRRE